MTENADRKIIVLQHTRTITLELTNRGDADRFIKAINERRVRFLEDGTLVDHDTDEVLGRRMVAVNETNYEMARNQWPARTHQNCDPYDIGYNAI